MDPYLEAHWRDIHAGLVIYACDALQCVLPSSLRARVEESVLLETPQGMGDHPLFPDVRVVEYTSKRNLEGPRSSAVAVAEPMIVDTEHEPVVEPFIEIIDRESGNRVVTVVEFLSPANKSPGRNRKQYQRKQREIYSSSANLVEIDLNRYSIHTLAFPLAHVKRRGRAGYMTCVRRVAMHDKAEVYPMFLWNRLPVVKVPLRPGDADVPLDLQALVDQCYRNGAYEGTLDYSVDPDPPLLGAERDWADEHLHELGLRPRKKPTRNKSKSQSR
jgi:hypothetical protein